MGKPDQPSAKSSNHIKTSKQKFYQQIPPQSLLIHVLKIKAIRSLTTKKNPSAVKFRTVFLGRGGRGNIRRGRSDTGVLRDRLVLILACHWLHYHSTGMLFSQIVDQKKKKKNTLHIKFGIHQSGEHSLQSKTKSLQRAFPCKHARKSTVLAHAHQLSPSKGYKVHRITTHQLCPHSAKSMGRGLQRALVPCPKQNSQPPQRKNNSICCIVK